MAFDDDEETASFEKVRVKHETDAALLCRVDGEDVWIPKSRILDGTDVERPGDVGTLVIPEWLAVEKGLV